MKNTEPRHLVIAVPNFKKALFCALAACCLLGMPTLGVAIPTGLYHLSNHPDGSEAKNGGRLYGLRLDGLGSGNGLDFEKWTFDFDELGDMWMNYDGTTIHIFGTTVGGVDDNTADYAAGTEATWEIDFAFSATTITEVGPGPIIDTQVTGGHVNVGMGALKILTMNSFFSADTEFDLRDHAKTSTGEDGNSFNLGDEEDDSGHRGFIGISGWGWMDHQTSLADGDGWEDHPSDTKLLDNPFTDVPDCCSDWLFTAEKVSEPGSLALLGIGLLGAGIGRRATRRRRTTH